MNQGRNKEELQKHTQENGKHDVKICNVIKAMFR